jgi:3-methylcrotonyl-CoA carboxylase alpha subunit
VHRIRGPPCVAHVSNVVALGDGRYLVEQDSSTQIAYAVSSGRETWIFLDGRTFLVSLSETKGTRASATDHSDALAAPMPATVVRIEVSPGQTVSRDSLLVMLEAMKMELPIRAPRDGRVTAIHCRVGEIVQPGVPLLEIS